MDSITLAANSGLMKVTTKSTVQIAKNTIIMDGPLQESTLEDNLVRIF